MDRLTGQQFENLLKDRHVEYKKMELATITRYGVQASYQDGAFRPIQSLPDFEGLAKHSSSQIVFDAKVCSGASFGLTDFKKVLGERKGSRRKQLEHMYARADYGATCFFLIHWNERVLVTKTDPPETFIFPVATEHPIWEAFESGELKSIKRSHCYDYGIRVKWDKLGKARTHRPNWLYAMLGVADV